MAPRGGGRRRPKDVVQRKDGKRHRTSDPSMAMEPVDGANPTYSQRVASGSGGRVVPSESSHRDSMSTPIGMSAKSRPPLYTSSRPPLAGHMRGGHPSASTHIPRHLIDEATNEESGSDFSDDDDHDPPRGSDGVTSGEDILPDSTGTSAAVRVATVAAPLPFPVCRSRRHTFFQKKLIGDGLAPFFIEQIQKAIEDILPYYGKINPSTLDKIWASFMARLDLSNCTDDAGRWAFEKHNKKK